MMKFSFLAGAVLAQGDDICCESCPEGQQKYYSVDMKRGHCGEACIKPSRFWQFKLFEKNLTIADGSTGFSSCADLGWPKYTETVTHGDPLKLLTVTLDLYDHADPAPADAQLSLASTCNLVDFSAGDECAQVDLDCKYTGPAKAFRRSLTDGKCADQGYTVKTGEQSITVPFLGEITATTYSQASLQLSVASTCNLVDFSAGDECAQVDLDCKYTGPAKAFRRSLTDGKCADQGYTMKTGEQSITVPFLGEITATTYSQPSFTTRLGDDICCESCPEGQERYYSVDMKRGHCGEACIKPSKFWQFKIFERNLTIADGSTGFSSCADLGWPKYTETVTHGDPFGFLSVTLDLYDHDEAAISV